MTETDNFLDSCLFFNTNTLSRHLLKLAQDEFKDLNISPAHASLMLLVYEQPGISPKTLSKQLHLTPSTITRFMDALVKKNLLIRQTKGKQAFIFPSEDGLNLKSEIAKAYKRLVQSYTRILGDKQTDYLSNTLLKTNQILENEFNNPST